MSTWIFNFILEMSRLMSTCCVDNIYIMRVPNAPYKRQYCMKNIMNTAAYQSHYTSEFVL